MRAAASFEICSYAASVTKGMIEGKETLNTSQNDRTNTARIIFFSLRNLYLRGRVAFDPDPEKPHLSYLSLTPEPNYIEPMHQAFLKYGPLFDPDPGDQDGAGSTYRTAHTNFLQEAIRTLYFAGREREAARYYAYMQETYFLTDEGRDNPFVQKTLYDFVMTNYLDAINVMSMRDALLQMGALIEGGDGGASATARSWVPSLPATPYGTPPRSLSRGSSRSGTTGRVWSCNC